MCADRVYVGQSVDVAKRWKRHLFDLKRGGGNPILRKMWEEDGRRTPSFVLVEEVEDQSNLTERESSWLSMFGPGQTMNLIDPHDSANMIERMSDPAIREKLREGWKRRKESDWTIPEEARNKMRLAKLGKKHDHGRKISDALKGRSHNHGHKISAAVRGRKKSEDHKRKISEVLKGIPLSEETRRNMREAQRFRRRNEAL